MAFKRMTGVKSPIQKKDLAPQSQGIDVLRVYEELQSAIKSLDIARANAESAAASAQETIRQAMKHALLIQKGERGIQGRDGKTPIKGVDYSDGRSPIFVSDVAPTKPQKGDIWYQPYE